MKRWLSCSALAFSLLASCSAVALERTSLAANAPARTIEIRVSGDAAALARVRLTASELLSRLDVEPKVIAVNEPETSSDGSPPLVVAYVDLRSPTSPSIDIEDGQTRQELTRRELSGVTSLETGVEALLHVLYLAVESSLQIAAPHAAPPPPPNKPKPPKALPRRAPAQAPFGLDVGPMVRVSSLGSSRVVPGGGILLEPRMNLGQSQAGLMLSAALHSSTELTFERGEAEVRPLQVRIMPSFDWLISSDVSTCVGLGGGLDWFMVDPVQAPELGSAAGAQTAMDPVVSALVGARLPISGRAFFSALASLDYDLAPTSFVVRDGPSSRPVLQLPRARAGLTLALSFSTVGERRFRAAEVDR